jgi:2-phosphosulfolactate phosphatase
MLKSVTQMNIRFCGITDCNVQGGTAVVIDVLRAFSTAAWAFSLGVERMVLTDDLAEALRIKATMPGALAMKDGEPAPGFELSNSPVQLQKQTDLVSRTIVQRTTAGTVGAVAARRAARLYCASFLNAGATAEAIRRGGASDDVTFVVSGGDGTHDEDRACAEYIALLLDDPAADAGPFVARVAASQSARTLAQRVADGSLGTDAGDVAVCMETDRFGFAMRAAEEDGLLVLRQVNL